MINIDETGVSRDASSPTTLETQSVKKVVFADTGKEKEHYFYL